MGSHPTGTESSPSASRRLGDYPTEGGDITAAGRSEQVVVAAWVLGWLGGPLPALMALVVTRPAPGRRRRMMLAAVWFWMAVPTAAIGIVVLARDHVGWLVAGWATLAVAALTATAVAVARTLAGRT